MNRDENGRFEGFLERDLERNLKISGRFGGMGMKMEDLKGF